MAFAFEKLIVYQKAMDFSDAVCAMTQTFPRGFYFLVDQLNRAAFSIAANIAEGNRRFILRDRKNFFAIGRTYSASPADRSRNVCRCSNRPNDSADSG